MTFLVVKRPPAWRLVAVALLTGLTVGVAVGPWASWQPATQTTLQPLRSVPVTDKRVALTFDISWGSDIPMRIVTILRQEQLRCTFFLSGPWSWSYPEVVGRLAADGHEIASHGYAHINMSQASRETILEQLDKAHTILVELTGQSPKYLRPPNGDYNDRVVATALERGYTTVLWSLDSHDWLDPGVDYIVNRVVQKAKPGDIILLHASDSASQTPEALPRIIAGLRAQGFKLQTLSELLQPTAQPGP